MPRLPLSISIVSYNEETNLRRCLQSVADLAEEIIVVDSGSTDRTCEIAREFGARVEYQPWLGHRDQKKVALGFCTKPWVLVLDCDEEACPAMRQSLQDFFAKGDQDRFDGGAVNRKTWFLNRWITHGDWYPDRKVRLLRREKAFAGGSPEHGGIELPKGAPVKRFNGDLLHYSFRNVRHYLVKHIDYSDTFLDRELEAGNSFSLFKAVARPFWRFFRAYILRLGFLDGFPGFWIAMATAFYAFVRYSRTYEDTAARNA